MTSHLAILIVFAFFVSVVFAALMREEPREQMRFGLQLLGGFVGAGVLLGWLMYPLPL